jgi:8-oxo-dGTP diphosphatase|nr:MAG TPA: NUDIX hydrolase [Caudoviricetes sp.]DAR28694.1 MAG TPA: NUDIX hydrolase [Herelleviridae sp.]
MALNLKALLGLQTQKEKIDEYKGLLKKEREIKQEVDSLAENYSLQKSQYDSLRGSDNVEAAMKAESCFSEFLKQQSKDLMSVYNRRNSIQKSIERLENDEDFAKMAKDIRHLFECRELWKQGLIKKSVYFDLFKAKQGKVQFADVLVFRGDKLLILNRVGERGAVSNDWCIPGGHVDPGETFLQAAKRELFEETGIDMSESLLIPVGKYIPKRKGIEIHYFMCHIDDQTPVNILVDAEEETGSEWINPYTELDLYNFIFDMKDNIKRILGIEVPDEFQLVMKSFKDGKISKEVFTTYCEKNPEKLEKSANKTFFTHEERKDLAKKGEAMPNGKYPIRNRQDLKDAIRLSGSSSMPKEDVKKWIKKRAKELNLEDELPEDWKVEKTMDTEDAHTLQRESLDGETKNIVRTEDGVGEGCSHEGKIEKAITFKRTVYEEKEVEVEEEPNKYTYGNFQISFSDNDGDHGNKFADLLATFQKVADLDKPFSVIIKTEDNGEQEWKFGTKFRLNGVSKTEDIRKSQEDTVSKKEKEDELEKSERKDKSIFNTYLNFLEGAKTRLKNIHWGEEDNSKHVYLDDLSENVSEFEDKIAEAGQTGFGRFKDGEIQGDEVEESDPIAICQMIFDKTVEFRKELAGRDEYNGEVSWIDDFLATLKQSKYRLQLR